jgi:hypothetical protein
VVLFILPQQILYWFQVKEKLKTERTRIQSWCSRWQWHGERWGQEGPRSGPSCPPFLQHRVVTLSDSFRESGMKSRRAGRFFVRRNGYRERRSTKSLYYLSTAVWSLRDRSCNLRLRAGRRMMGGGGKGPLRGPHET